jgi:hypothetical protein
VQEPTDEQFHDAQDQPIPNNASSESKPFVADLADFDKSEDEE